MTKGEKRRLRKAGELRDFNPVAWILIRHKRSKVRRERVASREEQHARYPDCGSLAWDDPWFG